MLLHRHSLASPVRLGAELGRGGEGTVYGVHATPTLVAKIYRKPPSPAKVEKLLAMTRVATPELLRVAAWPTEVLLNERREACGFLMPRIHAREDIHELYSPRSRTTAFPEVDFRFIVHVAANLARAFALIHTRGHVIADVNHGNALVGRDGTVVLIDCDSFQIRDRIRTYPCDVGVPLFTAPELQGRAFRGLRRSANHDAFGLAVLLFHLLFVGRHPYAGRYQHGDMPIERAIAEHRFAYSPAAAAQGMLAPPGTLSLGTFGDEIAALFTLAFGPLDSASGRPPATQWIDALERLGKELQQCTTSPLHYHPHATACCWCDLEGRAGKRLFGRSVGSVNAMTDLASIWTAIESVPVPGAAPELPLPARELQIANRRSDRDPETRRKFSELLHRWELEAPARPFDELLGRLRGLREEFHDIRNVRLREVATEAAQRGHFLDRLRIDRAAIRKLSLRELQTLASYGIETADDVEREQAKLNDILDPRTTIELLAWMRSCVAEFRYDPEAPPAAEDIAAVDANPDERQLQILAELRQGADVLEQTSAKIHRAREIFRTLLGDCAPLVAMQLSAARADTPPAYAPDVGQGCTTASVLAVLSLLCFVSIPGIRSYALSVHAGDSWGGLIFSLGMLLAGMLGVVSAVLALKAVFECMRDR